FSTYLKRISMFCITIFSNLILSNVVVFRFEMFFSLKRSKRWTSMEMCKFRQDMHQQLRDTYWDHAGNQTVCQSAMDQLPNLHVSKKADEAWILAYVECIREVYSHASGNLPELLFTEAQREEERKRYWHELSKMFSKVMWRIAELPDAHHPFSSVGRMACMMSYASLYSVFKTVAIECNNLSTVHTAAKRLNDLEHSEYSTVTDTERNQLKMLFENIDLINILSLELPRKYDLLPPPRRRSSADEPRPVVETPLSAHLRDFPKNFIDDTPKVEKKMDEPVVEEMPPLSPVIVVEEDVVSEHAQTSPDLPRERFSSRYATLEDYAEEIAAEAVTTALQQIVEDRKATVVQTPPTPTFVKPIVFVPFVLPPKTEEKELVADEPLQLSPFDPASCFKEQDKIDRYGRRGLFDSPLPVIGRKLPIVPLNRQHSSPSETKDQRSGSKDQVKTPEPATALLSPTFNQKVENKIIQAVLNEKPVSPMFPPPIFVLDEFDMHKEFDMRF
ncbi:hypothetical protein PMAYCL1PPCAC_10233, partial [Pristionchus mayeri]